MTMAQAKKDKDVIARLANRGEDVIHKLAELPGGAKALKAFNELRDRVDDLGKKVRGIDALEARIAALERQVAALKKPVRAPKAAAAKPKPAPRKPSG
jgi:polyhydroxyalkanoate synthesis regulator phasin